MDECRDRFPRERAFSGTGDPGPDCAFLDYDGDGWQDILLINGSNWPGHRTQRGTLQLYRNNRNATFTDVTHRAGLDIPEMYGMGVAVGDYYNDGFPDILISCLITWWGKTVSSAIPAEASVVDVSVPYRSRAPSKSKSNRNAIGATLRIEYDGISRLGW